MPKDQEAEYRYSWSYRWLSKERIFPAKNRLVSILKKMAMTPVAPKCDAAHPGLQFRLLVACQSK
jgi:hypothetical protein